MNKKNLSYTRERKKSSFQKAHDNHDNHDTILIDSGFSVMYYVLCNMTTMTKNTPNRVREILSIITPSRAYNKAFSGVF